MRKNLKFIVLLLILTCAAFADSAAAQSSSPDNPTPLTGSEIKGSLGGDKELYYSFAANPGTVTVTTDIRASEGVANLTLSFSTPDAADFSVIPLATPRGSKRDVSSFKMEERQTVIMKLASTGTYRGGYTIRLGGTVELNANNTAPPSNPAAPMNQSSPGSFADNCLPKSGTLTFTMSDGTVREIPLSLVKNTLYKP